MISYIKGELTEITQDGIVVETGNIGYEMRVPATVLTMLPSIGLDIKVYTYMHVREDALSLFGFLTKDDLAVFKLLITVNGIGPKGALGILSSISPDDLRFAVLSDDVKAITKAPGIGAKTASKLIIELKDKLRLEDVFEQKLENNLNGHPELDAVSDIRNETIQALIALGYSNSDALKVIRQIEISEDMNVETAIKLALKKLSRF